MPSSTISSSSSPALQQQPSIERSLAKFTFFLLLLVSICAATLLTWLTVQRFEQILLPQVLAKSDVIGTSVSNTIEQALKLGIPFDSLVGVHDFLSDTLQENPEIAYIQVQDEGHPGYSKVRSGVIDIHSPDIIMRQTPGTITAPSVTIGVRASYVQEKLRIMFGDAVVMSVVALITGLEIALFFSLRWLLRPLDTWRAMIAGVASGDINRDLRHPGSGPFAELLDISNQEIAHLRTNGASPLQEWYRPMARDIRIALFLFVLSEEILRSFFPLYVKELIDVTTSRLSIELAISAPLIAYMFFAGVGTFFGGSLIDRIGLGRAFAISAGITAVSFCGLAVASTLTEAIVWRSITAVGYAIATIACQVYIARTVEPERGARGLGIFVSAVTAACVCGAPIGAVVADMFGKPVALLCAAGLAVLSWLVFRGVTLPADAGKGAKSEEAEIDAGGFRSLLGNGRIVLLMLCAVMPGKLLLAGMLFYVTPLLLQQYELSQASIGQFFVLFYALLLSGNAIGSRLANDPRVQTRLISLGCLISGIGALPLFWWDSPLALAGAIFCFGCGQSITLTPANAVVLAVVSRDLPQVPPTEAIALTRIFERIGGIAGAALAAVLSAHFSYQGAVSILGATVMIAGLGTTPLLRAFPKKREPE